MDDDSHYWPLPFMSAMWYWIFIFSLLHEPLALHYVGYHKTATQNVFKSSENGYIHAEDISQNHQLWKIHFGTPSTFTKSVPSFAQTLVSGHLSLNYYALWPHCLPPILRKTALELPSFQQHECPLPSTIQYSVKLCLNHQWRA